MDAAQLPRHNPRPIPAILCTELNGYNGIYSLDVAAKFPFASEIYGLYLNRVHSVGKRGSTEGWLAPHQTVAATTPADAPKLHFKAADDDANDDDHHHQPPTFRSAVSARVNRLWRGCGEKKERKCMKMPNFNLTSSDKSLGTELSGSRLLLVWATQRITYRWMR